LDELSSFGISLVVVPTDTEGTLSRLADVEGLARVPATSTVVFRLSRPAGELTLLNGADAQAAATNRPLPTAARPVVLSATPGHARVRIDAAPAGRRLLVLAEPRDPSWRATLNGERLVPTRVYGWAQGWWLPADAGNLVVSRHGGHRHLLVDIEGALVLLALLLCIPARGRQR
jgi:hypothetical protein